MKNLKPAAIRVTLMVSLALVACTAYANSADDSLYRQAVADARAGHTAQALQSLSSLVASMPQRQDILGDYAVVLGWAGNDAEALNLLDKINRATAPTYVLEGLANSARQQHQFELAESLYHESITRASDKTPAQLGLALTLADEGGSRLAEAVQIVTALRVQFPQRIDVLLAYAEISTIKHDYFGALTAYQSILTQQPDNHAALRGKLFTLTRLGAPALAIELADRTPGLITAQERDTLAADHTASHIRWGAIAIDTGHGNPRFAAIDAALHDSDAAAAHALDRDAVLSPVERQLVYDRIYALTERYHMQQAIDLYQAIAARKQAIPAYVTAAAASAYLYLQQPQTARDLYRAALLTDPKNLQTRLGLFYALGENEEPAAALTLINQVVADTPNLIDAWSPITVRENPDYVRVLTTQAASAELTDNPGDAEHALHQLSDRAPFNMAVRGSYISSMRSRGWLRTAEQESRWVLGVEPDNTEALGERAGALLEMRDYQAAEAALSAAQAVNAEDTLVKRDARLQEVHNMRELVVEGTFGKSSGSDNGANGASPAGTKDHAIESWLYSSPMDYQYRAFVHLYTAQANFEDGTGKRERAGVGIEYRSPLVVATGEISHDVNNSDNAGAVSLAITPNDFWTFSGKLDSSSNEIPLQAVLTGIHARRAFAEAEWRANESRSLAVSLDHYDFSDGNERIVTEASWTERLIAGPVYKLEVTGGLYTSSNSLANTNYFNPSQDFSPTLEFSNEWLQWRSYTRSFRHRLVVDVGDYWQQSFGTSSTAGVRYEQEWQADDRLVLRYGIGRTWHPYDGAQTKQDDVYFALNWRF